MKALAWILAFFTGFLSLSQEILWVRLVGFETGGIPKSFAFVLGLFLFGVALGASLGKNACNRGGSHPLRFAARALLVGGIVDLLLPRVLGALPNSYLFLIAVTVLVPFTAACKAVVFPVAHHLGSTLVSGKLGTSVSRVYFLNIVGSTLGPIVTGFVLLDSLSFTEVWNLVGLGSLIAAATIYGYLASGVVPRIAACMAVVVVAVLVVRTPYDLMARLADGGPENLAVKIENRQGVVHASQGGELGDVVYGGNIYDGRVNVSLVVNSNRIDRVYLLSLLHPEPRRVLVIGLSGGSWTRVLSAFPAVDRIDVVEINPAYLDLIKGYPDVSPLLDDPRVVVHIDDGRRWLRRNPGAPYDLVVINATFHWRQYATSLLSREFMSEVLGRLAPGGILAFNATGSLDAFRTATEVFPFAARWSNFIYASDHDFRPGLDGTGEPLWRLALDKVPLLDRSRPADQDAVTTLLKEEFAEYADDETRAGRAGVVVTDANMVTEFRYGYGPWRLTR